MFSLLSRLAPRGGEEGREENTTLPSSSTQPTTSPPQSEAYDGDGRSEQKLQRPQRQQRGQQEYGRAGEDTTSEPVALRNLIVNYLPSAMDEAQLRTLFQQFGPVLAVKIIVDRETHESRGFGFVKFQYFFSATHAVHCLNGYQIAGKRLRVSYADVRAAVEALRGVVVCSSESSSEEGAAGGRPINVTKSGDKVTIASLSETLKISPQLKVSPTQQRALQIMYYQQLMQAQQAHLLPYQHQMKDLMPQMGVMTASSLGALPPSAISQPPAHTSTPPPPSPPSSRYPHSTTSQPSSSSQYYHHHPHHHHLQSLHHRSPPPHPSSFPRSRTQGSGGYSYAYDDPSTYHSYQHQHLSQSPYATYDGGAGAHYPPSSYYYHPQPPPPPPPPPHPLSHGMAYSPYEYAAVVEQQQAIASQVLPQALASGLHPHEY